MAEMRTDSQCHTLSFLSTHQVSFGLWVTIGKNREFCCYRRVELRHSVIGIGGGGGVEIEGSC